MNIASDAFLRFQANKYEDKTCPLCPKRFHSKGTEEKPEKRFYYKHALFWKGITKTTYCYLPIK